MAGPAQTTVTVAPSLRAARAIAALHPVGIGAQNEHSTDECIAVSDMEKAVKVLLEILRLCAA